MNPFDIIKEYYDPGSVTYDILIEHSYLVAEKAIQAAKKVAHLKPDCRFVEESAMLHDIGIFMTNSPKLGCNGTYPYICHGYLGRELLEKKGLVHHAVICETHVGVGISIEDIKRYNLPLPLRDMVPRSLEEQIVCYADKFYSKKGKNANRKKSVEEIIHSLAIYGNDKVTRFQAWVDLFEYEM